MKTNRLNKQENDNKMTIYRYQKKDLEDFLYQSHDTIIKDTAIPLGKDLAQRNKPEVDCAKEQVYCGVISGAYNRLMMKAKTELQSEIEQHHLIADKKKFDDELDLLEKELVEKENETRLCKRDLDQCDNSLLKKEKRYKRIRWFLVFLILTDTLLSSVAMQSMGNSLLVSYFIGLGIGLGIFFISERIPEIIEKGNTRLQKRLIAVSIFSVLGILFYVLGVFRTINFTSSNAFGDGVKPVYFMALNLFFVLVATTVSYFSRPTKKERIILDLWKIKKEELEVLNTKLDKIKNTISSLKDTQMNNELSRKQLLIYAKDIQQLIQHFYEEAQKTFMSTNLIHRSDAKIPEFFSDAIPKLPLFYNDLKL